MMKCLFLTASFVVFVANFLSAQDTAPIKIATDRLLWHENVDKQQQKLLNEAGVVALSQDPSINLHVKEALIHRVDELQRQLEIDSQYTSNIKKKHLLFLSGFIQRENE